MSDHPPKQEGISPKDGGCWYCYTTYPPLLFSCEFDTFVHRKCLHQAIEKDGNDLEAQIMLEELSQ